MEEGANLRLTLRHIQYLVTILDAGSMARAAETLHVTPTSLSLQMKHLEELVGTPLLTRHSRGVSATPRGVAFRESASEVLRLVQEMERCFLDAGQAKGATVRLGITPAVARMIGVEALTGLAPWQQRVSLALTEGWTADLMPKLVNRHLDYVVAYDLEPQAGIVVRDFCEEEFIYVCRAGLLPESSDVDLPYVLASNLVFYGQRSVGFRSAQGAAQGLGIALTGATEVQSVDVWRALIVRGLSASIAPFATVRDEIRHGEITGHRIRGAPVVRRIGICARSEMMELGISTGLVDYLSELILRAQPPFQLARAARETDMAQG